MNKSQLKTYAPKARRDFIQMVRQRADVLGLTKAEIAQPEVQGDVAVIEGRPYPRRFAELHTKLAKKIEVEGLDQFLDRVAYSWFNRFAALRFMEVNGYLSHPFRVLSNRDAAKSEPEILEHAAEVTLAGLDKSKVVELKLAGNKDAELYKMLLIAQCNELHAAMPFLFERINDETEILLSDNLLHTDSVIRKMVSDIDEENWNEVEIIGWLYQFYISEKKDEVIGKTVKSEDIPAATQLFTPNWIVKYMTQNSLGRLWLEANPQSQLKTKVPMDFYIEPAEDNPEVERVAINPEEITVLDPACGSGHILVEAYDLLKAIYTERGYSSKDIPRLILEKNLYGLDIDERAAQLASLALLMKARADDKDIFSSAGGSVHLNVTTIPDSSTLEYEPQDIAEMFGGKEQAEGAADLLDLFAQGKTLGSLIRIPNGFEKQIDNIEASIAAKHESSDMMEQIAARQLVPFVRAAKMLARKYDCVIANPPWMGRQAINAELRHYAQNHTPDGTQDTYSMFLERFVFTNSNFVAFVTPNGWLSLSSFEALRRRILLSSKIVTCADLERGVFSGFDTCVFSLRVEKRSRGYISKFQRITQKDLLDAPQVEIHRVKHFEADVDLFRNIPKYPVAYTISRKQLELFDRYPPLSEIGTTARGLQSGNVDRFIRQWFEVSSNAISRTNESRDTKWYQFDNGGPLRRWFGNFSQVVEWEQQGQAIHAFEGSIIPSEELFGRPGVAWTKMSAKGISFRYHPEGVLPGDLSPMAYSHDYDLAILGFLNSRVAVELLNLINPSMTYSVGDVRRLPFSIDEHLALASAVVSTNVTIARSDWDSFETSWDFSRFPILDSRFWIEKDGSAPASIEEAYGRWEALCNERISRMQELETENNRLFIDAYGLQDELTPDVPLDQITLARADKEKDTRRLLSYFIGCLMGRYSLDEPGLIYADAGNVGFDPTRYNAFQADDDGIVPVTDMEWFPQEAARQFEKFVKTVWGETKLTQNLGWIAQQLGTKAGEVPIDTIRRYFSQSFFKDHMQTYKKRPIYWLFSSGKQKAFECLVYLHRYNESTLPRMRHEYVLPLMSKLEAQIETLAGHADEYGSRSGGLIDTSSSTSERNKLAKQLETLKKKQVELAAFDEKLRHYADMRISLDLDDGVKVNYGKFGDLLAEVKTITGTKD